MRYGYGRGGLESGLGVWPRCVGLPLSISVRKYLLRQTLKFYSSLPNCTLGGFEFFFPCLSLPLSLSKDRCNRWRLYEFSKSAKIMKAVIKLQRGGMLHTHRHTQAVPNWIRCVAHMQAASNFVPWHRQSFGTLFALQVKRNISIA